jgi:ribosomal protein L37AE/L43A
VSNFENSGKSNELYSIYAVNRDGDLGYIECPDCHKLDLKKKTIFMCKDCGQHFMIYTEDGIKYFPTYVGIGISASGAIKLVKEKDGHFSTYVMPREYNSITKEMKVTELWRDLQSNGKDAHGHDFYRKVNIIKEN